MIQTKPLTKCIEDSFSRYAGSVILDRAICDARDMLKPSARMLIYSQVKVSKNFSDKPFIKSARIVGDCLGHFYEHGDASCYGTYMRMAKPFAMRYPLEDCQGNSGTIITTGDEAASRYTELRLAKPASHLYESLDKDTIDKWNTNFDDTERYPSVFPSIGFFNVVNGTTGIGVSLSSSIPQFNIKEVNEAIIKLIYDPETDFDNIVCYPDFATGALLLNKEQVYDSLKNGSGKSCRLRAVMKYDPDTNSIHITEIPYGVYTNTITEQLSNLVQADDKYGIESIHDGSSTVVDYTINLSSGVNPKKMMEKLCADTSLEYWYGINMTVLQDGRYPKVMGWRDLLLSHIDHSASCLRKEYEYDKSKFEARQQIVEGLLKAIANIDDVVKIIRSSSNAGEASANLKSTFSFTDNQVKAILDLKLNRLVHLQSSKLQEEKKFNQSKISELNSYLTDSNKFNDQLANKYREVEEEFGDERRTKIMALAPETESTEAAPIENYTITVFSNDTVRVEKTESLQGAKKGRKGKPLKIPKGSVIVSCINTDTSCEIYAITKAGIIYGISVEDISLGQYSIYELFSCKSDDKIVKIFNSDKLEYYEYLIFVTKYGMIKKTKISEYKRCKKGITAISLKENDEVINCFEARENQQVMIISSGAKYVRFNSDEITPVGRIAKGVKAILLKEDEIIITSFIIKDPADSGIMTISKSGKGKITKTPDYNSTSRGARGNSVCSLSDGDALLSAAYINTLSDSAQKIYIMSDTKLVQTSVNEVPIQNRNTIGVKIMEIKDIQTSLHILL